MIKINGFPLLHEKDCSEFFLPFGEFANENFFRPIYKWLPYSEDLSNEEKLKHPLRDIKEGTYFIGLHIISEKWLSPPFYEILIERFGFVLKTARSINNDLTFFDFEHIYFSTKIFKETKITKVS